VSWITKHLNEAMHILCRICKNAKQQDTSGERL